MKFIQQLSLKNKYIFYIAILAALIVIGILTSGIFTGKVISQNCKNETVCENKTVENCEDFSSEPICVDVCENKTVENCEMVDSEVCENICTGDGNETVCVEECNIVPVENCSMEIIEECGQECVQEDNRSVNCSEEVVLDCFKKEVCEDVVVDKKDKVAIKEVWGERVEKINFKENLNNLTNSEFSVFKIRTGISFPVVSWVKIVGDRVVVRIEAGKYWVEKSYSYPVENDFIKGEIEKEKIRLARNIVNTDTEKKIVDLEGFK